MRGSLGLFLDQVCSRRQCSIVLLVGKTKIVVLKFPKRTNLLNDQINMLFWKLRNQSGYLLIVRRLISELSL